MKFYTKGVTGFVDEKDVVRPMIRLMDDSNFEQCKNQRYLLSAENLSYQQVFSEMADGLGVPRPTIWANDFLLALVWRIAAFASLFTRKTPFITKEAATGRNEKNYYNGSKVSRMIGYEYLQISTSIKQTTSFLKNDIK